MMHEHEIERNRIEQQRIRAHQMKMATIESARQRAEASKLELQQLREKERLLEVGSPLQTTEPIAAAAGDAGQMSQLEKMRAQFAARQTMPEVVNAGKMDDTDRKIEKFEEAKRAYLTKQQVRPAPGSASGSMHRKADPNAAMFLAAKKL